MKDDYGFVQYYAKEMHCRNDVCDAVWQNMKGSLAYGCLNAYVANALNVAAYLPTLDRMTLDLLGDNKVAVHRLCKLNLLV